MPRVHLSDMLAETDRTDAARRRVWQCVFGERSGEKKKEVRRCIQANKSILCVAGLAAMFVSIPRTP